MSLIILPLNTAKDAVLVDINNQPLTLDDSTPIETNTNIGGAPASATNPVPAELIQEGVAVDHSNALSVADPWLHHAEDVILGNFGDTVSVHDKSKDLIKFGRVVMNGNTNWHTVEIQADTTIENETFLTANTIDYVVSSSASDIAANNSSDIIIEGHTISGSDLTFVSQSAVLLGQTVVALTTPLARVTRVYNNDSAEIVGAISVYDSSVTTITSGAPTAGYAGVHLTIEAGHQNSEKCSTSISSVDYYIVTSVYADVLSKSSEDVELSFEYRPPGKVFREIFNFSAKNGVGTQREIKPYRIIPKNSDVRIRARCDGSFTGSLEVGAGMIGVLAIVV